MLSNSATHIYEPVGAILIYNTTAVKSDTEFLGNYIDSVDGFH